ncbi:MAG: PD40 domain-containing protein, partial [Acidobacteriota bacterium]|nr:PD40 domain-containing protein [Acidobacteriota bacterium]
ALGYSDYRAWCGGRLVITAGGDREATIHKRLEIASPPGWKPRPLTSLRGRAWGSVACAPDGRSVVVQSQPAAQLTNFFATRWQLWRVRLDGTATPLTHPAAQHADESPQLSPDGKTLYVTVAEDNFIAIFDVEKRAFTGRIATGVYPNRVAITPDGRTLVYSLMKSNAVGFADVASKREIGEVKASGPTMSLSLSRDGKLAYTGIQEQDKVVEISVPERRIVQEFATPKGSGPDPVLALR